LRRTWLWSVKTVTSGWLVFILNMSAKKALLFSRTLGAILTTTSWLKWMKTIQ
jgi:hypothetical protein